MIHKPILFFEPLHLSASATEHPGCQAVLSDHSQVSEDQLDSSKPALASPVSAVMSLWGVKEPAMRVDRLEN